MSYKAAPRRVLYLFQAHIKCKNLWHDTLNGQVRTTEQWQRLVDLQFDTDSPMPCGCRWVRCYLQTVEDAVVK